MTKNQEEFFSWTARHVVVATAWPSGGTCTDGPSTGCSSAVVEFDEKVVLGCHTARLLAFCDDTEDYLLLAVGDLRDRVGVPVAVVTEERLLIAGGHTLGAPALYVVVGHSTSVSTAVRRTVDRQLCLGGPIREVVARTRVHSVIVEWCTPVVRAA